MKRGTICIIFAMMLLLPSLAIKSPGCRADIAPARYAGSGNMVIFIRDTRIIMDSYNVDVLVSPYGLNETLSYCLMNPTNMSLNQTVMIPYNFISSINGQYNDVHYVISANDFSSIDNPGLTAWLTVDGLTRQIRQKDIVESYEEGIAFQGVYTPIAIAAKTFTNITLKVEKSASGPTAVERFTYLYSAETAAFWNSTVRYGRFHLLYTGDWNHTNFSAPNAVNNGREVYSEAWGIDVRNIDANYTVEIVTGIIAPPYNHRVLLDTAWIAFATLIGIYMLVIWFLARKD